jgi:hypothetical protein
MSVYHPISAADFSLIQSYLQNICILNFDLGGWGGCNPGFPLLGAPLKPHILTESLHVLSQFLALNTKRTSSSVFHLLFLYLDIQMHAIYYPQLLM